MTPLEIRWFGSSVRIRPVTSAMKALSFSRRRRRAAGVDARLHLGLVQRLEREDRGLIAVARRRPRRPSRGRRPCRRDRRSCNRRRIPRVVLVAVALVAVRPLVAQRHDRLQPVPGSASSARSNVLQSRTPAASRGPGRTRPGRRYGRSRRSPRATPRALVRSSRTRSRPSEFEVVDVQAREADTARRRASGPAPSRCDECRPSGAGVAKAAVAVTSSVA